MLRFGREARERFPEYHPLPLWPEAGGYLPFGDSAWLSGRLKVAGPYRFDRDELAEAATFRAVRQTITD